MKNPIILLSGSTGVGTSTFSFELAKKLDISTIISTDTIREVIRSVINKDVNPSLDISTYQAGQTLNYRDKDNDPNKK